MELTFDSDFGIRGNLHLKYWYQGYVLPDVTEVPVNFTEWWHNMNWHHIGEVMEAGHRG